MRNILTRTLAALIVFAPAAFANQQQVAADSPVRSTHLLAPLPATQLDLRHVPDMIHAFASGLPLGTRVCVHLMGNQKLKGEFVGVRDDRFLFRPDRDPTRGTIKIAFPAIYSIKVLHGPAIIKRP